MTLTTKQQAQVARAPDARRAALSAMFARQNGSQRQTPPPRRGATAKAQSQRAVSNRVRQPIPRAFPYAFDAFDKRHLPVDEVTAPYSVTNFVSVLEFASSPTMDQIAVICPRVVNRQEAYTGPLTDYVAMLYDANETISGTIPTLSSIRCPIVDMPPTNPTEAQYFSVRARLHNLSVRIECLGTNSGLIPPGSVYVGTVPALETGWTSKGGGEALKIKQAWADDSIAVGYLRSVPAASLVNSPVCLHAAVAENVSYKAWRDFELPPGSTDIGSLPFLTALEPIVVYIPRAGGASTTVNYRIVVGQQWCARHPHNIMLRATQKQHPATSPTLWHQAVSAVKDVGEHLLNQAGNAAVEALASRARNASAFALGDM